ncbi:MAG: hypothetical protein J0I60_09560 [Nitrosospira sp.]|nr:hypothetical protein [Nitrosospira sp.]
MKRNPSPPLPTLFTASLRRNRHPSWRAPNYSYPAAADGCGARISLFQFAAGFFLGRQGPIELIFFSTELNNRQLKLVG